MAAADVKIVSKKAATANDATDALTVTAGERVAVSVIPSSFTGTVELQRSFDLGSTWRKVNSWTAQAEVDYEVPVGMQLRLQATTVGANTCVMELRRSSKQIG